MAPRPDVGRGRSSSIEHRGGAQGWTGRAPARQEACPWPSRLVVMLLAMKGSVCWSPSAAPAPPAVWLCAGAQVVAMSVCGTRHAAEACLSCMARTGLSGLMVQSSEPQEPADGDESSPLPPRRRCSAIARFFVSRTARSLTSGAEAWLQWHAHEGGPRHCSENDGGRAARFSASVALSSSARSERFVPVS